MSTFNKIAIIGIVGVPGAYGGFETLVENLIKSCSKLHFSNSIIIFCSGKFSPLRPKKFLFANLYYINLNPNGIQSIIYDIVSMIYAIYHKCDRLLVLGTSGAIMFPFIRILTNVKIVVNIDGIEWRRNKWSLLAKSYLKFSEYIAIKFAHQVISDNEAISDYVLKIYNKITNVIPYGGDHVFSESESNIMCYGLPDKYSLSICRIEPENNLNLILNSFSVLNNFNLVIVGNWSNSKYGIELKKKYQVYKNIFLLDPIYNLGELRTLRKNSISYIHGHSAGGTNPSLVEAMHFGIPIFAFDCIFNRFTTENKALFFSNQKDLIFLVNSTDASCMERMSADLLEIAKRRYTWEVISAKYFALFDTY